MILEIKQSHIDQGKKNQDGIGFVPCKECVLALAISDLYGKPLEVGYWSASDSEHQIYFYIPAEMRLYILEFEARRDLKPRTFEILESNVLIRPAIEKLLMKKPKVRNR